MPNSSSYLTAHSADLNKISARIPEAREFIHACDPEKSPAWNAEKAFLNRWYGNAGEAVCAALTKHFYTRFNRVPGQLLLLRRFINSTESITFPIINHFYMLLADPYYRWAASEYLVDRFKQQRFSVAIDDFDAGLQTQLPPSVGQGSLVRYAQNLRTSLRDNGLLAGQKNKLIVSPSLTMKSLAYILYALSDSGVGVNEFDGSPVHRSLLKPRERLIPLFQEGERLGYWEFTGDKTRLTGNLRLQGLEGLIEVVSP